MFREKQKHKRGHQRQNSGKLKIPKHESPELTKYMSLLETFSKHDKIIIMLDARAPQASRYKDFENHFKDKIIYCLNKIDCVPRDMLIGWLSYFNSIAPTVAISAIDNADPLIDYLKTNNITDFCITGLANSGKRTLAQKLSDFKPEVTQNWHFLMFTFEHLVIHAFDTVKISSAEMLRYLSDFVDQCTPQSLMEVFGYTYSGVSSEVFRHLKTESESFEEIFNSFLNGLWDATYPFYTPPPTKTYDTSFVSTLSAPQKDALRKLKVLDAYEKPWIVLIELDSLNNMLNSLLIEASQKTGLN